MGIEYECLASDLCAIAYLKSIDSFDGAAISLHQIVVYLMASRNSHDAHYIQINMPCTHT